MAGDWIAGARRAVRVFSRSPLVAAAAVLSLALGVGLNATLFSWVRSVLIEPLPGVPDQDRLVSLSGTSPREGTISLSWLDYLDYREAKTLEGLLAHEEIAVSLQTAPGRGPGERVWGLLVSENYFDVLKVSPALGRGFLPEEARPGTAAVVLGHDLWRRRFGADPGVLGRTVHVDTVPVQVVGVAPAGFHGSVNGLKLELFVPMGMAPHWEGENILTHRGNRDFRALGRLAPGVTLEQARAEVTAIAARLRESYPEQNQDYGAAVHGFWTSPDGAARILGPALKALGVLAVLVLAVACANVASLLLGHVASRRREIAVRRALGASRGRIVRQLVGESLLLAACAGALGVLLATWGAGLLIAFAPPTDLPVSLSPEVDAGVLLVALLLSVGCGTAIGLVPALAATRDETDTLRPEAPTTTGGRARARARSTLVVAQIAVAAVLLVSAVLLVRALDAAQRLDPGFRADGVLLASFDLKSAGYDGPRSRQFLAEALRRVGALPGVEVASLTRRAPLGMGGRSSSTLAVPGWTSPDGQPAWAQTHAVGPDFVRALGAGMAAGREFGKGDVEGAPLVVMVDETMARRYWGDADPIGRTVELWRETWTVAGVVRDYRHRSLDEPRVPNLYVPALQVGHQELTLLARALPGQDPAALAGSIRSTLQALDPSLAVYEVRPLAEHMLGSTFVQRMAAQLLSGFGLIAVVLAAIGLYGVVAHAVAQRTREIGIRRALGADDGRVARLVLVQGGRLAGIGLVLGLALASGAAPALRGLLLGTSPHDVVAFTTVGLLLGGTALAAVAIPTWRALRVRPAVALRYE